MKGLILLFALGAGIRFACNIFGLNDDAVPRTRVLGRRRTVRPEFPQRIQRILDWQVATDLFHSGSTPRLFVEGGSEIVKYQGKWIQLLLDQQIARTRFATVFKLKSTNLVIKYQASCVNNQLIHPLVRDFMIMSELSEYGVTPHVVFVSPPVLLPFSPTTKTDFDFSREMRLACIRARATVRYIVMEKGLGSIKSVVETLHSGHMPLLEAVYVMIQVIERISFLHSHGIVHGDIHIGNVVLMQSDPLDVRLIDFESSFFVEEKRGRPDMDRTPNSYFHPLLSHWNMQGYRYSFRDDVYKALWMGARMMNGDEFTKFCDDLTAPDPLKLVRFKAEEFIFSYPGNQIDIMQTVAPADVPAVRGHLEKALELARSVDNVITLPPHQLVLDELRGIVSILTDICF